MAWDNEDYNELIRLREATGALEGPLRRIAYALERQITREHREAAFETCVACGCTLVPVPAAACPACGVLT